MGKAAGLSEFDRGQFVMAQRFGTSIIETTQLVGSSRSAVVKLMENQQMTMKPAADSKALDVHEP